jgi:hypothetical protein
VIAKNQISIVITFSTPSKIYILRSEKLWQKRDIGPEWPADRRAAEQSDERAPFSIDRTAFGPRSRMPGYRIGRDQSAAVRDLLAVCDNASALSSDNTQERRFYRLVCIEAEAGAFIAE